MSGGVISELSEADVEGMLLSVAWDEWRKEMHEKPKLSTMKLIVECEVVKLCIPEVKV